MEKEYYRRYEPFFGEWRLGRFIGAGSYGKVFEIERRDALGTVSTSAMKALTIPSSQDELDAILASGMDEEGVSDYFQKYVDDIKKEIALMQRLKGHSTIVSYEDHRAYPHPDGRGWDILIRMELLRPINDDLRRPRSFAWASTCAARWKCARKTTSSTGISSPATSSFPRRAVSSWAISAWPASPARPWRPPPGRAP